MASLFKSLVSRNQFNVCQEKFVIESSADMAKSASIGETVAMKMESLGEEHDRTARELRE